MNYYSHCNPSTRPDSFCRHPACLPRCLPCCPSPVKGATGATGATGPAGSTQSVYGGAYNSQPQQIIAQTAPDELALTLDTPMPLKDIDLENNSLQIKESGVYQVFYSFNASSKVPGEIQTLVRKNQTDAFPYSAINTQFMENTLPSSSERISYAVDTQNSFIANLDSGDILDLSVFFPNLSFYPNLVVSIYRYGAVLYAIKID